jgi:hypothetical protein
VTESTETAGENTGGDHEEFTPVGTFAYLGIYFLILVFLWVFMYFVEFLGNDLTVIG